MRLNSSRALAAIVYKKDISIVIGFRDWGLDRLSLSIKSLVHSFENIDGEVIVSDYGSEDRAAVEQTVAEAGGRYLRVETSDVWSRSRALNAGLALAEGRLLACTDADMLFTPGTIRLVVDRMSHDQKRFYVLQCRDLPPSLDASGVQRIFDHGMEWDVIDRSARLRPRWGMGGFIVLTREAFDAIRGLDERMEVYGGEDIDLANRLRRAGYRLEWLEDKSARMYHIWHPPSRNLASKSERGSQAILRNRSIMLEDNTALRNIDEWMYRPAEAKPPITVAIATYNRAATLLESIHSVLAQTMPDFELVIMDDGSTDETRELLASIDDERMQILHQPNQGVAAARNAILSASRGQYTVIHDSDDLMPPWRLRTHLEHLSPELHGNYGAAVNFDDATGQMSVVRGKRFSAPALIFNSQVLLHGTMMVNTDLLKRVSYNPSLRSGTDYNLNVRLAKIGAKFCHTGELHLLRRVHSGQMTETDSNVQKLSSNLTNAVIRSQYGRVNEQYHRRNRNDEVELSYSDQELMDLARPYLPDHLVKRSVLASQRFSTERAETSVRGEWLTRESFWSETRQNPIFSARDVSWAELAHLSREFRIEKASVREFEPDPTGHSDYSEILDPCVEFARQALDEYRDLVRDVYVSVYSSSINMGPRPSSVIAEAVLTGYGEGYLCRISSEFLDDTSTPYFVFRLGNVSEATSANHRDGTNL